MRGTRKNKMIFFAVWLMMAMLRRRPCLLLLHWCAEQCHEQDSVFFCFVNCSLQCHEQDNVFCYFTDVQDNVTNTTMPWTVHGDVTNKTMSYAVSLTIAMSRRRQSLMLFHWYAGQCHKQDNVSFPRNVHGDVTNKTMSYTVSLTVHCNVTSKTISYAISLMWWTMSRTRQCLVSWTVRGDVTKEDNVLYCVVNCSLQCHEQDNVLWYSIDVQDNVTNTTMSCFMNCARRCHEQDNVLCCFVNCSLQCHEQDNVLCCIVNCPLQCRERRQCLMLCR